MFKTRWCINVWFSYDLKYKFQCFSYDDIKYNKLKRVE